MEERAMWNILGREMTPYAVSIWIACVAALALFLWQGRSLKKGARFWTAALGILLGLFCARLYYVLARLKLFLDLGLEIFFVCPDEEPVWGGTSGAAFWGAVGGICLAALLAGKITKEKISAILDALAPSAALGIAISRFGEYSIGEGIGPEVIPESLHFFPVAVCNEYEEWNYALFMLEGMAALVICLLLLTSGRKYRDGYRARMFLILYAACQVVLEALRRDSFLRWLFVRVNQLASALVLLAVLVFGLVRWYRKRNAEERSAGKLTGKILLDILMLLLPLFALLMLYWIIVLQQPIAMTGSIWWKLISSCWPVTLAAMILLCVFSFLQRTDREGMSGKQAAMRTAVFAVPVLIIVAMEFGIDKSADLTEGVGYLTEAVCCVIMGVNAWKIGMKN